MTNEEAAIKIAEELAVKEANRIAILIKTKVIKDFLDYYTSSEEGDLYIALDEYLK